MSIAIIWMVVALVIAGLELLTGTFYLLAIAVGVACGGVVAWLHGGLTLQFIVASVISLVAVVFAHRWRKKNAAKADPRRDVLDIGQKVQVKEGSQGRNLRVLYRGTEWDADLAKNAVEGKDAYFIVDVEGSRLILHENRPE